MSDSTTHTADEPQDRVTMPNEDLWITTRISEARNGYPLVTEAVSARMEQLLADQLSERQLSAAELTSVAMALIKDMVPAPPEGEAQQ